MNDAHIVKSYDEELTHLQNLTLKMGGLVVSQLKNSLEAFRHLDTALAELVIARDNEVDQMEVLADSEIAHVLARRCPVSTDLRFVITVSKSVSDLECIGDEAVRIAGLVSQLAGQQTDKNSRMLRDVRHMGEMAMACLQGAMDVFDHWDKQQAQQVFNTYREMDEEFQADLRRLLTYVMEDFRNIGYTVAVVLVIKALERIGHHAQNLVEYVIFQNEGEDVRNRQPSPPSNQQEQ